jgi:hypothetical protein
LRRVEREPLFSDDTKMMTADKCAKTGVMPTTREREKFPTRKNWEADHPKIVEELERERQNEEDSYLEFAANKGKNDWRDRYSPHLDLVAMDKFASTLKQISQNCQPIANKRAAQHISWLRSPRVLHAFDVCDQDDPISGEALKAQVFQCIFGMEGSTEAEGVLTEWATATQVTRENLLLRAFTRDQNGVKKEADKTLAEITEQVKGSTEFTVMPATRWQSAIKGLVSAVKSTDSALDEWMRKQGQSGNYLSPKHIANVEARCFYFVSAVTRGVARKGIGGKIDMAFVARANAWLISSLGDLATKLEYDTLNAKIDPSKWDDFKQKYKTADAHVKEAEAVKTRQQKYMSRLAERTKATLENAAIDLISDAQCKAKLHIADGAKSLGWSGLQTQLEESAKRHRNYDAAAKALAGNRIPAEKIPSVASPTNNYHQVRLGGALAGIESLALLSKIWSLKDSGSKTALVEVFASAMSVAASATDMMYLYTKSVRELPKYAAIEGINHGADIVRGGFKLTAGLLASGAGGITAYIDWQKADKEGDPFLRAIFRVRSVLGWASTGTGLLAAYSYSAPLLTHLAAKDGRSSSASAFLRFAADRAHAVSERVLLLRTLAWIGWIGVFVTMADLSYAGYRWYVDYTATTRWLSRCTFRRVKTNKGYSTSMEEIKEWHITQHKPPEIESAKS